LELGSQKARCSVELPNEGNPNWGTRKEGCRRPWAGNPLLGIGWLGAEEGKIQLSNSGGPQRL